MKNLFKGKIATGLVVVSTLILAGVAIYTALRLYQLRSQPVAPNAPTRPSAHQATTKQCEALVFNLTENSPTPTPTGALTSTPTPTSGVSETPTPTGETTVTPTNTVNTVTPTPIKPPSIPEPPQCTATKPSAPILLSVERSGTSAILKWTKVDLATHYVISYGTSPDNFQYGVPNTGNQTSYTIEQLGVGVKYYFTVYAVNDCMPSEGSTVITSVAGISTSTELPATGVSIPTVLGIGAGILIIAAALVLAI